MGMEEMSFIAQKTPDVSPLYPYLGLLFLIILFGGLFLMLYRARLKKKYEQEESFGFSLADLKKLRDNGELSEQEYEVAKNKMLAKLNVNMAAKGKQAADLPPPCFPEKPADPGGEKVDL
jgi:hypothetical protein